MSTPDKLEAVKKVGETLKTNPAEEMQKLEQNKEHFQSLINSSEPLKPTSFERIDNKAFTAEDAQSIDVKPAMGDDNVTSQRSGSATDQEGRRRQGEPSEEVAGVSGTGSKNGTSSKSLMDEVGSTSTNAPANAKPTVESLRTQAKDAIDQIDKVKATLSQTRTDIKPSYQTLLRNRLGHIDDNVKIALSKAGTEYTPPPSVAEAGKANPAQKFLDMLSNSQSQLEHLQGSLETMNASGATLTPGNMMAIQMKMNIVQQQIELFTSLLNKALESTKTIMNVQV